METSNATLAPRGGLFLTQIARWLRVLITGYYISRLEISYFVLTQSRTKLRSSLACGFTIEPDIW